MIRRLLIATLLLCGAAMAQPPQGKFGPHSDEFRGVLPPGRWWKNSEIVKNIGLSDSQVQKIEQIFQENRLKLVDIHANLQKEEIKLEPMLEADNPDESAVMASIDRIASARATLEKANAQMAFAIRRVLTPEQWKKLREMRPRHGDFPAPVGGPRDGMRRRDQRAPMAPPSAGMTPPGAGDAPPADEPPAPPESK
jgi:Spy/CpxP family protein refolding chaperone